MQNVSLGSLLSRRWMLLVAVFGAQPLRIDDATLPWAYDTTTQPGRFRQRLRLGRHRLHRLPNQDRRRRHGREVTAAVNLF
jgi:hypothetical protein